MPNVPSIIDIEPAARSDLEGLNARERKAESELLNLASDAASKEEVIIRMREDLVTASKEIKLSRIDADNFKRELESSRNDLNTALLKIDALERQVKEAKADVAPAQVKVEEPHEGKKPEFKAKADLASTVKERKKRRVKRKAVSKRKHKKVIAEIKRAMANFGMDSRESRAPAFVFDYIQTLSNTIDARGEWNSQVGSKLTRHHRKAIDKLYPSLAARRMLIEEHAVYRWRKLSTIALSRELHKRIAFVDDQIDFYVPSEDSSTSSINVFREYLRTRCMSAEDAKIIAKRRVASAGVRRSCIDSLCYRMLLSHVRKSTMPSASVKDSIHPETLDSGLLKRQRSRSESPPRNSIRHPPQSSPRKIVRPKSQQRALFDINLSQVPSSQRIPTSTFPLTPREFPRRQLRFGTLPDETASPMPPKGRRPFRSSHQARLRATGYRCKERIA